MKKVLVLVLLVAAAAAGYWLFEVINAPIAFKNAADIRQKAVIEQIKDIREAQRAYRKAKGHFTESFDSLINFVKNDSLIFEIKMGDADDSIAVKEGRVRTEEVLIAVKDTIFGSRNVDIDKLSIIPFSNGQQFKMGATVLITGAQKIEVPVFCATAEYKTYLSDLGNDQELINLYDFDSTIGKFPGIKVGSLDTPTNEAGNWED